MTGHSSMPAVYWSAAHGRNGTSARIWNAPGKASQRLETLQRAALEKRREEMRRWQAAVDDLEQGNYERLHARIAENEAVSRATLAALGLG